MADPGALPKYIATAEMLMRDIRAGRIAVGSRLPSERDMAMNLNISVGTLRNALNLLVKDGFLNRVHGSGNYVTRPENDTSIYAFFRLERPGSTGLPTSKIVSVSWEPAPDSLAVDAAWCIRRIRALDGIDVAAEEIFAALPEDATITEHSLSQSLYYTYRQEFNLWVSRVEDSIGVAPWPEWGQLEQGMAGHVKRQAWAGDGSLVEVSTTWFDPNQTRYLARLA